MGAEIRNGEVVKPAPTFHSLRHPHGSALIASGWDIEEVSARLGHSNTGITHKTYIHAYESAQRSRARADRLEAMYGPSSVNSSSQQGAGDQTDVASLDAHRRAAQ